MILSRSPSKRRVQVKSGLIGCLLMAIVVAPGTYQAGKHSVEQPADFLGHAVTPEIPVTAAPAGPTFEIRKDCRIARFGVAPWLKPGMPKDARWEQMTRLWLASIGMPAAGHDGAIATLRGKSAGEVMVKNTTGAFNTTYRVGDRWVSCLGSTTRFVDDTVEEPADSYPYEFAGKRYDLVIIQRCGNVTELPPGPVPFIVLPLPPLPGPAATPPGAFLPYPAPYPLPGAGLPHSGPPGAPPMVFLPPPPVAPPVHQVSEPPGWALALLAVVGLAWFSRKKK